MVQLAVRLALLRHLFWIAVFAVCGVQASRPLLLVAVQLAQALVQLVQVEEVAKAAQLALIRHLLWASADDAGVQASRPLLLLLVVV